MLVAAMRNWIDTGSEVVGQANRIPLTVSKSSEHKATRATRVCCGTLSAFRFQQQACLLAVNTGG
jgi:hypothetical protein